jgi:hypothetical protein
MYFSGYLLKRTICSLPRSLVMLSPIPTCDSPQLSIVQAITGGRSHCRNKQLQANYILAETSSISHHQSASTAYHGPCDHPYPIHMRLKFLNRQCLAVCFRTCRRLEHLWWRSACLITNQPKSRHTLPMARLGTRKGCPIGSALR